MGLFLAILLLVSGQAPSPCADLTDCRQQALAAAAAGDYETFHDLAWRAVQKGKPNDHDLMYLLARAQSLSGRPSDALVMLGRLVDQGVAVDAATNDDFRRVRALKGWPELEARIAGTPAKAPTPDAKPAASDVKPSAAPEPKPTAAKAAPLAPAAADTTEEALSFAIPPFEAVGLAYDAVSRRFIVGDRKAGRLMVIDEVSHHVNNLVSAASAGFYDTITGFEIDPRRGDLWVASVKSDTRASVLHKLQLVSGRVIDRVDLAAGGQPANITDVAVASDGTVFVLDADGSRIFRVRPKSHDVEEACKVQSAGARSMAMADDRVVYVASDGGIAQIDLATRTSVPVRVPRELDVTRVEKIRWHDGSLVVTQRAADGGSQIARARLDGAGRTVTRLQVLAVTHNAGPQASTVTGSELYYLVGGASIRKARLK